MCVCVYIYIESYCDSILGVCVAQDEWESVLEVLDIMKRHGFIQERSTYRACLQACLEAGNGASAKEILQAMDKAGVAPTPYDIGLTVAAMCRQKNDASTTSTYTTSVDGTTSPSTNTGWWRKALALLKSSATNPEIVVDNNHPDNVIPIQAYNVILECMVEERQWKEAVRLLRLMEDGCAAGTAAAAPSSPTTTRSISTTSTSTANTSTTTKTRPVGGYHPAPEVSTYREVIECCVATNQAEQAAQILYSMKGRGVKVNTTIPLPLSLLLLLLILCSNVFRHGSTLSLQLSFSLSRHCVLPFIIAAYSVCL